MSLLMFQQEAEAALILTDTLATTPEGGAFMFQSKAWTVPHMNMAVAITGLGNFGVSWNDFLSNSLLARDIEMVDQFAPGRLRQIWSGCLAEFPLNATPTVTVYHFGFPDDSDHLVRYVYRSIRDFESERWDEPGFGIKPEPEGALEVPDDLDGWVSLAERVRADQNARPADQRIHIGGELYLLILQNFQSRTQRLHRFDDYDQAWLAMNARLRDDDAG